jgi:hypothetical protein
MNGIVIGASLAAVLGPRHVLDLADETARLEGELRAAHLAAHLETRAILTQHQVARYAALRGYAGADHGAHAHE